MRPRPGGPLTEARATYDSIHGRIASAWRIQAGGFDWQVTVPPNTTATAHVPAAPSSAITEGGQPIERAEGVQLVERNECAAVFELPAGHYNFVARRWS